MNDTILSDIKDALAPYDATALKRSIAWAHERRAALDTFRASEEYAAIRRNAWVVYPKMFAIVGGKGWYSALESATAKQIETFMTADHTATSAKRNAKIAQALEKIGVQSVLDTEITYDSGGFEGVYKILTDSGEKRVTITAILAGGHSIQRLHVRVLVKVR